MRRLASFVLAGMATAAVAAPLQAATLRVGIATEPWDLDPAIRTDTGSGYPIQNIYDPLVEIGPDKQVTAKYAVAKDWSWSNQLKTLTMQIKQGITFHDGSELTAEDVAYNINWQLDPDNNAPNKGLIGPVDSVEVKDPQTLVVNFSEPYPGALQNWARALDGIVPEGAHGERSEEKGTAGFAGTALSRNPVGSGPYEFVEWVSQRVPADEVPGAIANLVESFAGERDEGESFRAFVARHDDDELDAFVEAEETDYEDPMMHNTKRTWYPYAENDSMEDAPPTPADD